MRSIKSLLQDKELRGLWVSLAVHAVVLLIVFVGFEFSSPETHIQPINAVQAVAIDNRSENRKRLEEQKAAQRKKERAKKAAEEKRKQDKLKKEKLKQEKIKQEQLKQEKLKQQKAEQEKRKQAEAKAAEAKKQLLAKQKLEAKKLAEAKKKAAAEKQRKADEAKRREAARRQAEAEEFERRQQEEQRLLDEEKRQEKLRAEKAAQEAEARARQEDIDRAIYQQEIARFMTQHWIKPPNTKTGYFCEVIIMQSRGGHILDVNVIACNGGDAFRASVERAANKPDQLPLPRNPSVFESKVRILFEEK